MSSTPSKLLTLPSTSAPSPNPTPPPPQVKFQPSAHLASRAARYRCIIVAIYVGSLTCMLCSPLDPLDARPKPCMRMLLEASRAAPQDLPPDMEFFQVPLHLKMADSPPSSPPPLPCLHLPLHLDQIIWKLGLHASLFTPCVTAYSCDLFVTHAAVELP